MADTSNRGFASMDDDKQREIASQGGKAAHDSGNAHEFSSEEARKAGRKGGETVSQDRDHMAEIGSEGGKASHGSSAADRSGNSSTGSTRGGSTEQHREAGRQSHKNS
jgi:uncharacterized protein